MSTAQFPPPPPPGLNYIEAIRPSLNFILVLTPLGSVLVPLILTLFFFSTPQSRRHPVFILNILACLSGIIEAALNAALETKQILYPLEPISKELLTSVIAFSIVSPVFIDSILLFRILAFYPFSITPTWQLVAIFALPALVKCGRFTAVVMYLHSFTHSSGNLPNVLLAAQSTWPKNPYILAEWSLQMIDNTYASVFFLYKIYTFRKQDSTFIIRSKGLLAHLRSLFVIALGNFVFPVVMNIASIILIATDPSFINGSYILLSNNYVAIIGVVFATIWTRRQNWNKTDSAKAGSGSNSEKPSNAFEPATTTKISTLHFVNTGRQQESEFESSDGTQLTPSSEWAKEKEGGPHGGTVHVRVEKETKSGWSDGVQKATTNV